MARYDDLNTNMIAYATIISCLLLLAILQGTQALCYNMVNAEAERKAANSEYTTSSKVIREQRQSLNGYSKVALPAPAEGQEPAANQGSRIQIPIDRAIEAVIQENQGSKGPGA